MVLVLLAGMKPTIKASESSGEDSMLTLDQALGTSREKIVGWLSSHENDDYYLGTPYRDFSRPWNPEWCIRPLGRFENDEPQLNCTGFVADVFLQAGADEQALWDMVHAVDDAGVYFDEDRGGYVDADYWYYYTMIRGDIQYYTFDSVEEALESGLLNKGDLIYFQPYDYTLEAGYDQFGNEADCHIGFFWGDQPDEDVFWHSNLSGAEGLHGVESVTVDGNQISQISPCSESTVYVFPLSEPEGSPAGEAYPEYSENEQLDRTLAEMLPKPILERFRSCVIHVGVQLQSRM